MAKDKLTEYSATNASNDVIGDISVAEGMLPSAVNNALREQMTHLKNFSDGTDAIDALAVDNLKLDGNTISSTDANGNVTIDPNGTGDTIVASGDFLISNLGRIGVAATDDFYIGASTASHSGLYFGTNIVYPMTANSLSDGATSLGHSSNRFNNLYLSGGAYIGGTGSANYLDDYEEGTWTPTAGGNATYNSQSGFYVKVGGLVHISGIINISSIGTGTTQYISGLPFSSIGGTGSESAITVQFVSGSATNFIYICLRSSSNNLWFSFKSASGDSMGINPAILKNGTEVAFAGTYRTDS